LFVAVKQFIRHVLPAVIRPLRVLWNEIIAFIFFVLAIVVGFNTWRNFNQGQNSGNPALLLMGGGFALMLLYFGVSSYMRARRISRS
jgi:hypothetical protein